MRTAIAKMACALAAIWLWHTGPDVSRLAAAEPSTTADGAAEQHFRERVLPLLVEHCHACHSRQADHIEGGLLLDSRGGLLQGGDSGPAVSLEQPDTSRLLAAIQWTDESLQMPPKGKLPQEAVEVLAAWVRGGAVWPKQAANEGAAVAGDASGDARSRALAIPESAKQYWAFQPLRKPDVPAASERERMSELDWIVARTRQELGLAANAPAEPAELLRRVYFDLVGLPPTPEELAAWQREPTDEHYRRIVDRLLESPGYGERWGRHWLDVVRYTESNGFEYDRARDNAWHYRDYVIRAFQDDVPYDAFMRQQIAGDVIEPVTADGIIATSLLVSGPYDQAGNAQANQTQRMVTREEELEDLLSVVGQTFLGVTINCARCHQHKFDPIPQADYYRFQAVFAGIKHGERSIEAPLLGNADAAGSPLVVYCGTRVEPPPTRLLRRGDVLSPGDPVAPGGLSVLAALGWELELPVETPEAQRRIRFAAWLADPHNPLPARVMANRIWQYHFGEPLVATPNDFGASGQPPLQKELLNWLAAEFVEQGWSVKHLHRVIVQSATYRQSSAATPASLERDPDNRYLWRYAPRRLEAEMLRDAMLFVSGQLNPQRGGPSFRPFTTTDFNATFYHPFDRGDAEFNRRSVYRMNINSGKDPLLDAFDCPDPSIKTPRRNVTTTPLQSLGLMNGSFVQRQAEHLAKRVEAEAGGSIENAVRIAYRWTLGRDPTDAERDRAVQHGAAHGLKSVCWALLNSTEFLYVR